METLSERITKRKAEAERKEAELMAHWFEQYAYVNGGWSNGSYCGYSISSRDKHGEGNPSTIPDHIRMEIARCLLPDIIAFCEAEQGKREFEEWKKKRLDENTECEYIPSIKKSSVSIDS